VDGTVQLSAFEPSKEAKYAVYGISQSGSDWLQYKVMELATERTLPDTIEWAKVSQVAWHGDGFYYSRYPEPPEGHEKASINENHQVFFHKLGTPQSADTLVYEDPANPQRFHTAATTEDERFLILEVSDRGKGLDGNALFVRDLTDPDGKFAPLVPEITNDTFYVVDNVGDQILVATNHGAPNWRVVQIDPRNIAEANWKTILAERPEPIDSVTAAGGKLFATYLKDVATRAYVFGLDGKPENEIALPGVGTAGGFGGPNDSPFVFYVQLAERRRIYATDIATRAVWRCSRAARAGYDTSQFEAKEFSIRAGRHANPMFLVPQEPYADGDNDAALRLRRLQHRRDADVQRRAHRALDKASLHPPTCGGAQLRTIGIPRHEGREAERVRRLHRGGRMAHRAEIHVDAAARDHGSVERRAARRRRLEPAPRSLRRRGAGSRRHGHAALSQIHDRLELDRGLRFE
jgi:prolyl oligopeptidase